MVQALSTKKKLKTLTLKEARMLGYDFWKRQETLDSGHFDNLKYDDGKIRVWVSRQSIADYGGDKRAWEADRLTIEKNENGDWVRA